MKRILIVEDEASVREGLLEAFSEKGYEAAGAATGEEAERLFSAGGWDLCILEVRLPDMSGFEVCRRLREKSSVPILFLTAFSDEANTVRGLDMGGDDYVAKPFRLKELFSRVQALLRRSGQEKGDRFLSGNLIMDLRNRKVERDGKELLLTPKEGQIAWLLMNAWPYTVSRDELVRCVWDKDGQYIEDNTVRVHISRLREKLGEYGGISYFAAVRGVGYRWNVPVEK